MPGATVTKVSHGPVALVPMRFNRLMSGLGASTVSVAPAVLPVPVTNADTGPLVLT